MVVIRVTDFGLTFGSTSQKGFMPGQSDQKLMAFKFMGLGGKQGILFWYMDMMSNGLLNICLIP